MGGDDTALRAVFTIDNPTNLKRGNRFDYELVITNQGNKTLVIPQCLNWEDVESGSRDQRYIWATVGVKVSAKGDLESELDGGLTLYGTEERPSSELVLKSGESVRILGSEILPISMSINGKIIGEAKLAGVFYVGSGWLHRTPTPTIPDGYRDETRLLLSAVAEEQYLVSLGPEQ